MRKTDDKTEESSFMAEKHEQGKHPNSIANLKPYGKGVSGNPGGRQKKFKKFLDFKLLENYNSSALIKNHGGFAGPRYILHDRIIDTYNTIQKNTHKF